MLCAYQPTTRPVALSVELAADDGTKRRDRTKKTWQDIMNEDLKEMGLDWTGKAQSPLPEIAPSGGQSSPNFLEETAGTKSKQTVPTLAQPLCHKITSKTNSQCPTRRDQTALSRRVGRYVELGIRRSQCIFRVGEMRSFNGLRCIRHRIISSVRCGGKARHWQATSIQDSPAWRRTV